jgi:hypothetical protein
MVRKWFLRTLPIHVYLLLDDLDAVPGHTDDALYVMRMILKGEFENDYVSAANVAVRQDGVVPMPTTAEDEFVHQQMIANQQGGFHGLRWDLEGLNDKGSAEKSQQYGDKEGFD